MAWGQGNVPVAEQSPFQQKSNPTPSPFPDWDAKSQTEVLAEWEGRKTLLATAKEREMEFRKYVVSRAFPNAHEGMNNLELNNGYVLKASIKYNYKLDPDNSIVEKILDELAATGNEGAFLADRLVNWKPTLSVKEYRELAPQYKKIIDKIVTLDDAAPSLEIKAPKAKK